MKAHDRESWLTAAADKILADLISPALRHGVPSWPFKVSVGFPPNTRPGSKTLAVCCTKESSAAGYSEIFVTPQLDDSLEILAALVHELIHYTDNCESGHKGHFERVARAVGLEGPLTATHASLDLKVELYEIIDALGEIPHAKLDIQALAANKQSTRMLKVTCSNTACGFMFRASQTQIAKVNFKSARCPACTQKTLTH